MKEAMREEGVSAEIPSDPVPDGEKTEETDQPEQTPQPELTEEQKEQIRIWKKRNAWIIFWAAIVIALLIAILGQTGG